MMISNLPSDLVEEIFSRIPLKFMGVVRSTCREWDTLCRNRNFTKTPIEKAFSVSKEGESQMILLMDYSLYLISVIFDVVPSIKTKCKLTCLDEQVKISRVCYSEGLLLCVLEEEVITNYSKLVVWNPYSGQTRWIEPIYKMPVVDKYIYALGYVSKSCRSHRILRFYDDYFSKDGKYLHKNWIICYEIYDFDSGLWTILDVTPYWRISCYHRGVSLNGNTYWCATKRNSRLGVHDHIICFDFTRNGFGPLLPLPTIDGLNDYVNLSCVREEQLAVSLQHMNRGPANIDIWITTKIEADQLSWSKFLTMDMGPNFDDFGSISSGSFFINEEKKIAMCCYTNFQNNRIHNRVNFIREDGYFKEMDFGKRRVNGCSESMNPYVPSLVKINQPVGGRRKKQSNPL